MIHDFVKILELSKFFIVKKSRDSLKFQFREPSSLLMKNIKTEWFKYILLKSEKNFPVFIQDHNFPLTQSNFIKNVASVPAGLVSHGQIPIEEEYDTNTFAPVTELKLKVAVPETDGMQFFLQWQRYRKIWWSMISTSPGLFSLSDINYKENGASVDINAHLSTGFVPVESIALENFKHKFQINNSKVSISIFECSLYIEQALFTLLTDANLNKTTEDYIRLHRIMAPYKITFAIDSSNQNDEKLFRLAKSLNYLFTSKNICTWNPEYQLSLTEQLFNSRVLGIPYVAIIDDGTLMNGIFFLMNNSTMIKEQIHIADIESYALKHWEKF